MPLSGPFWIQKTGRVGLNKALDQKLKLERIMIARLVPSNQASTLGSFNKKR
jgi:hypothetical protein